MIPAYNPREIEPKWQERWEREGIYRAREDDSRPKWYALTMFPYTSGDLHIGHWYALAPSDALARFMRMRGYNVMHPIGFDAFGLPAENAAIKYGVHPREWTMRNIERMRRQLRSLGASYDWSREVITCLPEYYRWTQWFFLKLYEGGLAYRAKAPVNWCPQCQTVLANEQVVEGRCERCGTRVYRRELEQWFFRITKYAEELLKFDDLDWPEHIKGMQRNWIGRSEGVEVKFDISHLGLEEREIKVFTTRIDTIYGVTFLALAPEHPLSRKLSSPDYRAEVERYIEESRYLSDVDRESMERERTGVFTGSYARHPLTGEEIPIWIADYVLPSYGTGAVMGVPAHDRRDFEFARRFGLPVKVVIRPPEQKEGLSEAYEGPGEMMNSGEFSGMWSEDGKRALAEYLERKGLGRRAVSYRLRDWLISRQRYWGAPIPIIYCSECGIVPVPEEDLPVLLPEEAEFKPTGESPLKYCDSFVNTSCPRCGRAARRETDTMDTFMCSSWYFLRYTSPGYDKGPFDPQKATYWLPVDLYTGGAEHATMHLLYARFFIKALNDLGIVSFREPFKKLFTQGTIIHGGRKMSKSHGNVIPADPYVEKYGADAVRLYLMFLGPWEQGGEWNESGLVGIWRWLNRVWRLVLEPQPEGLPEIDESSASELRRMTHRTIKRVYNDLDKFRFNTMIAALMEYTNFLSRIKETYRISELPVWREAIRTLILLLAPSAPHIAEELWERIGNSGSVHLQPFPSWDEELAREQEFELVIQVNGKVRDKVKVPASITEEEAREIALKRERIRSYIEGREIRRIIFVPGRLINIVLA